MMEEKEKNILDTINFEIYTYLSSLIELGVFKVTSTFSPTTGSSINLRIGNLSAKKKKTIESLLFHKFSELILF